MLQLRITDRLDTLFGDRVAELRDSSRLITSS